MNKTLRLRRVPVAAGRPGQVLVATVFDDAERGVVRSAAAPLLAATLPAVASGGRGASGGGAALGGEIATGGRVTAGGEIALGGGAAFGAGITAGGEIALGEVIAPQEARTLSAVSAPDARGVMFAASYLDRRGAAAGFALVAHRDDVASLALAEQAANRWLAVLRSRRVLIADVAALCWGGQRALSMIDDAAAEADPLFVLGHPVAPPGTGRPSVAIGASLDAVPDGGRVFLPAHGVPLAVRAEAAARGLPILDGTCPLVAAVQGDAAAYASRGDTVVVIGRASDAVVPVLAAHAGEAAVIVPDVTAAEGLQGIDPERVSFVIDPGMAADEALRIVAMLRRRFRRLRGHHFDVLCDSASDRALAIASVAGASELLLVVTGDPDDPLARAAGGQTPAVAVTGLSDLGPDLLAEVTTIGLVRTLSAPPGLDDLVLRTLSGLGPLAMLRRGAYTAPVQEPVPVS